MSPTSRRVLAAAVAALVAVLTGIVVGLVSQARPCPAAASQASPTQAATQGPVTGPSGTVGEPAQVAPAQQQRSQAACTPTGFRAFPALIGLVGAVLAGAAVLGTLLVGEAGGAQPAPARPGPAPGPGEDRAVARQARADRAALVQACIYVRDRTTSRALAERLGAALAQAGVTPVEPAGALFDPAHHEAGGAAPSDDPGQIGRIAAVEVPGYADRGKLLRAPVVTVYQARNDARSEGRTGTVDGGRGSRAEATGEDR
jgi:hypothetical protein